MLRHRLVLFLRVFVALSMIAAAMAASASPTSAQEEPESEPTGLDRCDISSFAETKLVDSTEPYDSYPGTAVGYTEVATLSAPIPAGRILVTGGVFDDIHLNDVPDFETTISQFAEQFTVKFFGADGSIVGETDPTPDLPDLAPFANFALPSIDLTAPAVSVQLIHAGDGSSANSLYAECINVDVVGADPDPASLITPIVCPLDAPGLGPDFQCGFHAVPEERDDPNSRLINIAFAITPGDGTKSDPVFYLEGGPGWSPMAFAGFIMEFGMGQAADGRDVVLVDQRGTGYAQPNLLCPFDPEFEYGPGDFVGLCGEALRADGVRLSSYTTVESAADIASLRVALGYDEYNLFGGSYGTDLGLTIMRDHPEGIRSSVLDSVFPPTVNPLIDQGIGALKMLDSIVDRCAADAACNAGFPDLRPAIIAAFDNVAAEPILVDETSSNFVFGGPFVLDPASLMAEISFHQDYEILPALLTALADSDPAARQEAAVTFMRIHALTDIERILADILGPPEGPPDGAEDPPVGVEALRQIEDAIGQTDDPHSSEDPHRWGVPGPGASFSDGFQFTVICAEESAFFDDGGATEPSTEPWTGVVVEVADSMGLPAFPGSVELVLEDCEALDVQAEDPIVTEPVTSDIPSLVLLTDVDFQTVPEWSRLTAETLTNSFLFEFPNLSHVVTFSNPCPASMVAQFYASPGTEPDSSCIADLPGIVYSGDPMVDPGPVDDAIAEFEATLEDFFGPPPGDEGPPPGEGPPPEGDPAPDEVQAAQTIKQIVTAADYDATEHAAILRLYLAIFGRTPDVEGAKYWIDINNQGFDLLAIAGFMSDSQEWASHYGGASDGEFVAAVYANVLGRDYDQAGYDYWLGLLIQDLSRHEVVFYVTANAEFSLAYPFQP